MSEPARYSVDVDPARALVRIVLSGFFDAADYAGFSRLRGERQALLDGRPHVTIVDIRGLAIQSQEMVSTFAARLGNPPFRADRLAFVVAPTLTRFQARRATAARDARHFTAMADAEAWVLDRARSAAAA